jgi:hypothetical protein
MSSSSAGSEYQRFLANKAIRAVPTGMEQVPALNPKMFAYQSDVVRWALKRGRAALFEDCGLGKTLQELEWAKQVSAFTGGPVIINAPLAVSVQHGLEAEKFGYDVTMCSEDADVRPGINITNYEKLHKFDAGKFAGVVLDESGILKNFNGKTRNQIIESFSKTQFRLAGTATPAPNDYMELGNHSEFLGVMTRSEMLATFFVHDGGDTSKWRIKGHAQNEFWKWVCTWAVNLRKPSDLGYSDEGFELPPLNITEIAVDSEQAIDGYLFAMPASSLKERRDARRASLSERVDAAVNLCRDSKEQWVIWCDLNDESKQVASAVPDCVEITGSDTDEFKIDAIRKFLSGEIRKIATKPSMFGHGLNLQCCHNFIACGLSDSWELYYQFVRRHWRFGQKHPVNGYVITSKLEGAVVKNIKRKEADSVAMAASMVKHMANITMGEIKGSVRDSEEYQPTVEIKLPLWLQNQCG